MNDNSNDVRATKAEMLIGPHLPLCIIAQVKLIHFSPRGYVIINQSSVILLLVWCVCAHRCYVREGHNTCTRMQGIINTQCTFLLRKQQSKVCIIWELMELSERQGRNTQHALFAHTAGTCHNEGLQTLNSEQTLLMQRRSCTNKRHTCNTNLHDFSARISVWNTQPSQAFCQEVENILNPADWIFFKTGFAVEGKNRCCIHKHTLHWVVLRALLWLVKNVYSIMS